MKKKWISLLLSTTMAMGMIMGTGVIALADSEPEEITWMFWDDVKASQDLVSLGYGDIIDRFNETYDGQYHVNVVTTNLTEYETKLSALIAAGDTPDVFICNPGPYMKRYIDTGAVADLTDTLKTDEKDWYDTFNPGVFDGVSFDDKICAVPVNGAIGSLFYNTQIFEEQGIEVPKTYDELIEACKKLQDAGISPIACSGLVLVSRPFGETRVGLRVFRGGDRLLAALGTDGGAMCALELWQEDATGGFVPANPPDDPQLSDFLASGQRLAADVSPAFMFCLEDDGLDVRPLFWGPAGLVDVPVAKSVRYIWKSGAFEKTVSGKPE